MVYQGSIKKKSQSFGICLFLTVFWEFKTEELTITKDKKNPNNSAVVAFHGCRFLQDQSSPIYMYYQSKLALLRYMSAKKLATDTDKTKSHENDGRFLVSCVSINVELTNKKKTKNNW